MEVVGGEAPVEHETPLRQRERLVLQEHRLHLPQRAGQRRVHAPADPGGAVHGMPGRLEYGNWQLGEQAGRAEPVDQHGPARVQIAGVDHLAELRAPAVRERAGRVQRGVVGDPGERPRRAACCQQRHASPVGVAKDLVSARRRQDGVQIVRLGAQGVLGSLRGEGVASAPVVDDHLGAQRVGQQRRKVAIVAPRHQSAVHQHQRRAPLGAPG